MEPTTTNGTLTIPFLSDAHMWVRDFHTTFDVAIGVPIETAPVGLIASRAAMMREELHELVGAVNSGISWHIARELADLVYVTVGTAVALGFSLHPINYQHGSYGILYATERAIERVVNRSPWASRALSIVLWSAGNLARDCGIDLHAAVSAVHTANLSKLGADGHPIVLPSGKVCKGPHYRAPDMRLAVQQSA